MFQFYSSLVVEGWKARCRSSWADQLFQYCFEEQFSWKTPLWFVADAETNCLVINFFSSEVIWWGQLQKHSLYFTRKATEQKQHFLTPTSRFQFSCVVRWTQICCDEQFEFQHKVLQCEQNLSLTPRVFVEYFSNKRAMNPLKGRVFATVTVRRRLCRRCFLWC